VVTEVAVAAGPDWASATTAIGTVAVAVVAVGIALFAEWRAGLRLREEHKRSDDLLAQERALHAKEIADERALADERLAQERAHSAVQLQEDRVWNRRVELYARINLALRRYVEQPPTDGEGRPVSAADFAELASVASEAGMLASEHLADLLYQFMYHDADSDEQLELWNTFQHDARAELSVDRVSSPQLQTTGSSASPGCRLAPGQRLCTPNRA